MNFVVRLSTMLRVSMLHSGLESQGNSMSTVSKYVQELHTRYARKCPKHIGLSRK